MIATMRLAMRRLWLAPAFSVTALLMATLGIGAVTAMFTLVNGVLLRPLPYPRPHELVSLTHTLNLGGVTTVEMSDAAYLHYRASTAFRSLAVWQEGAANVMTRHGDPQGALRLGMARISAGLFSVLESAPVRGRAFSPEEQQPGAAPVVVIGERFWRTRFGAEDILGGTIIVDGIPHTVVGIMPRRFQFPSPRTDLWLPAPIDPARTESATFGYRGVGRLDRGATIATASADLQRLLRTLPEAFPGRLTLQAIDVTGMQARVEPLRERVVGGIGRTLWVVLGLGAFVLLMAAANVTNLFLVRAESRQHELMVRRTLGARRRSLLMEFLAEGLLVAGLATLLALAAAWAGSMLLRNQDLTLLPRLHELAPDARVGAVAVGCALLVAVLASLVPVLRISRETAPSWSAPRTHTSSRAAARLRDGLIVTQMALALVLISAAALMMSSYAKLRSVHPGFEAAGVNTFRLALPPAVHPSVDAASVSVISALETIAALPGVTRAGVMSRLPFDDWSRTDTAVFIEDQPLQPGQMPGIHQIVHATPGALDALSVPVREGRQFRLADLAMAPAEVLVTRAFAERYWPGRSAIGRRIRFQPRGASYEVVGVTADLRSTRLEDDPDQLVFLPLVIPSAAGRYMPRDIALVVRGGSLEDMRRGLGSVLPASPLFRVRDMEAVLAGAVSRTRLTMRLLSAISVTAIALATIGLYGVIAYTVGRRRREIAVRLALGATPAGVQRAVMRQAGTLAALGIAGGVVLAVLSARAVGGLLYDTAPLDPPSLAAAMLVLALITLAASWLPARRAAALEPAEALRADS